MSMATTIKCGDGYRLLVKGELMVAGDEWLVGSKWEPIKRHWRGSQVLEDNFRRKLQPIPSPWRKIADGPIEYPAILLNASVVPPLARLRSYGHIDDRTDFTHWTPLIPPEPDVSEDMSEDEIALKKAILDHYGTKEDCPNAFEHGFHAALDYERGKKKSNGPAQ